MKAMNTLVTIFLVNSVLLVKCQSSRNEINSILEKDVFSALETLKTRSALKDPFPSQLQSKSSRDAVALDKTPRRSSNRELQSMLDLNDITALETSIKDPTLPNLFAHGTNMKAPNESGRSSSRNRAKGSETRNVNAEEALLTEIKRVEPKPIPKPSIKPSPLIIPFNINGNKDNRLISPTSPDVVLIETENSIIDVRRPPSLKQNSLDLSPNQKIKKHSTAELQDAANPQAEESRLLNNFIGTLLPKANSPLNNVNAGSFGLSLRNRNMANLVSGIARNNVRVPRQVTATRKAPVEAPIRGIIVDNSLLKSSNQNNNPTETKLSNQQSPLHSQSSRSHNEASSITGLGETKNLFDANHGPEYELISPEMLDALRSGNYNETAIPSWIKDTSATDNHPNIGQSNFDFAKPDNVNSANAMLGMQTGSSGSPDIDPNNQLNINLIGDKEIEQLINNVVSSVDMNKASGTGIPVQMIPDKNNSSPLDTVPQQGLKNDGQSPGSMPAVPTPLRRNIRPPASGGGQPRSNNPNQSNLRQQGRGQGQGRRLINDNNTNKSSTNPGSRSGTRQRSQSRQMMQNSAANLNTNLNVGPRRINNNLGNQNMRMQQLGRRPGVNSRGQAIQNRIMTQSRQGQATPNMQGQNVNVANVRRPTNNRNQRNMNQIGQTPQFGIRQGVRAIAQNLFGPNGAIPLSTVNQITGGQRPSNVLGQQLQTSGNTMNTNAQQPRQPLSNTGTVPEENRVLTNNPNQQVNPISARQVVRRIQQTRALQDNTPTPQGNRINDLSVPANQIPIGSINGNNPEANLLGRSSVSNNQQRNQNIFRNTRNRNALGRLLQSIDLPKNPQTGQVVPILIYPVGFGNGTSRTQVSAISSQIASLLSQVLSRTRVRRPIQSNSLSRVRTRAQIAGRRNMPNLPVANQRGTNARQVNSPQRWTQLGLRPEQINAVQAIVGAFQSGLSLSGVQRQRFLVGLQNILRSRVQSNNPGVGSGGANPGLGMVNPGLVGFGAGATGLAPLTPRVQGQGTRQQLTPITTQQQPQQILNQQFTSQMQGSQPIFRQPSQQILGQQPSLSQTNNPGDNNQASPTGTTNSQGQMLTF